MQLPLTSIRMDGGTQPRAQIDLFTVEEYAEAMQEGATFPPVTVFHDGEVYWLADGFHRIRAAEKVGLLEFPAEVRQGTVRDAKLFSASANSTHGLRRTNEDKRRAVLMLLNDPEWSQWSDNEIARRCGVTHPFVGKLRTETTCNGYKSPVRIGADGRTINTERIGTSPKAEPLQEPEREAFAEALLREIDPEIAERCRRPEPCSPAIPPTQPVSPLPARTVPGEPNLRVLGKYTPPPPETNTQKVIGILEAVEYLAKAPLTGSEFVRLAQAHKIHIVIQQVREYAPSVRVLLDDIEEGQDD